MCQVTPISQHAHFKEHFPFPNCINVPEDRWAWQWKQMDRARYPSYNSNQHAFSEMLKAMHESAVDEFGNGITIPQGIERAKDYIRRNGRDLLEPTYRSVYERTGMEFASGLAQNVKNQKQELTEEEAERLAEEEAEEDLRNLALLAIRDFLTANLLGRMAQVQRTNARVIGQQLGKATRQVAGIPEDQPLPRIVSLEKINEISRQTRENLETYYRNKSSMMSVTETVTASNLGLLAAAQSLRIPLIKMWLSQRDSRVRQSHIIADGQERMLNEYFRIGGYKMRFPGDFSQGAPADEIIHCRCVLIFFSTN